MRLGSACVNDTIIEPYIALHKLVDVTRVKTSRVPNGPYVKQNAKRSSEGLWSKGVTIKVLPSGDCLALQDIYNITNGLL
jgi:hypothetical protein